MQPLANPVFPVFFSVEAILSRAISIFQFFKNVRFLFIYEGCSFLSFSRSIMTNVLSSINISSKNNRRICCFQFGLFARFCVAFVTICLFSSINFFKTTSLKGDSLFLRNFSTEFLRFGVTHNKFRFISMNVVFLYFASVFFLEDQSKIWIINNTLIVYVSLLRKKDLMLLGCNLACLQNEQFHCKAFKSWKLILVFHSISFCSGDKFIFVSHRQLFQSSKKVYDFFVQKYTKNKHRFERAH